MSQTITAIATSHGVGSIAIVRLSGEEALKIATILTHKEHFAPRFATLCNLYDNDELLDQAIVIYFKAPFSFTGEDIVEFQCHGGIIVASKIVELAIENGARLAQNGEFSKRAFLNGKIDLSKAEAIAKMIEAKSEDSAKVLSKVMKGELKEYVEDIRDKLLNILAHIEVSIDYAEEDLPPNLQNTIAQQLLQMKESLTKTLSASKRRAGLIEGFRVAIVGKPNVGKSSFLNKLLNYERSIVSDIAGTTRDTIEEYAKIGTHVVKFVDTAGIRQSEDTIEQIGVERSLSSIEEADLIVALFDASRPFERDDSTILEHIANKESLIVVLNKIDQAQSFDFSALEAFAPLKVSIHHDIEPIIQKANSILSSYAQGDDILLISTRQMEAVNEALKAIESAFVPLTLGEFEIFAFHINEAIRAITRITRPVENAELLDKMFGQFCLGK